MTPMGYAWLVLKTEFDPDDEVEEDIESVLNRLMSGDNLTSEELTRLVHSHGEQHNRRRRNERRLAESNNTRTPTPLDWFNPFRMTRPHMSLALDQIHDELERRGGNRGMDAAREASANNPFFRHTRDEMQQAMQMMNDELERRGRPPLSDEHFGVFSGGQRPILPEGTFTDEERMEYMRNFGRNRPARYQYRRDYHSPSPEETQRLNMGHDLDESTFDRDELMSRLMNGDILTEKELKFLQNPPEDDPNSAEYDPHRDREEVE